MKQIRRGIREWPNEHRTFTESIQDVITLGNETTLPALEAYRDTTRGIQGLIRDAIRDETPLRAVGAGWSWTKIATARNGIMLDTMQLSIMMSLSASAVLPGYTGDIGKLVFSQCGSSISFLNRELRKKNLSLKTCGASNGQTIVGAMSTGAHGSTLDIGGVQDYIVGMHIIVGVDRHIWLERESSPVVSASFLQNLDTVLVPDDNLFNAALVSFGSCGFIHGVLMETEELYLLETNMQRIDYDDTLKEVMETLDVGRLNLPHGSERPFHFGVSINPYDKKNKAYVYTHYKRTYRDDYDRPVRDKNKAGPGDDAPCFIGLITQKVGVAVPIIVNLFLSRRLKEIDKQFGTLGEIFSNTDIRGKSLSTAIGIPLDEVNRVTDLLFEINDSHGPFTGIFAYRYIKKTEAMLGFTHFPEFTCIVEMDGLSSDVTMRFYRAVWDKLIELGIRHTFHWGKMSELDFDKITTMYEDKVETWINARNELLDIDAMRVFSNPLLETWGLARVNDPIA